VVAVPLIVVPDSQPVCVCAWWADIWTDSIDSADYVKMSQLTRCTLIPAVVRTATTTTTAAGARRTTA
jgi:hypothetical protein